MLCILCSGIATESTAAWSAGVRFGGKDRCRVQLDYKLS